MLRNTIINCIQSIPETKHIEKIYDINELEIVLFQQEFIKCQSDLLTIATNDSLNQDQLKTNLLQYFQNRERKHIGTRLSMVHSLSSYTNQLCLALCFLVLNTNAPEMVFSIIMPYLNKDEIKKLSTEHRRTVQPYNIVFTNATIEFRDSITRFRDQQQLDSIEASLALLKFRDHVEHLYQSFTMPLYLKKDIRLLFSDLSEKSMCVNHLLSILNSLILGKSFLSNLPDDLPFPRELCDPEVMKRVQINDDSQFFCNIISQFDIEQFDDIDLITDILIKNPVVIITNDFITGLIHHTIPPMIGDTIHSISKHVDKVVDPAFLLASSLLHTSNLTTFKHVLEALPQEKRLAIILQFRSNHWEAVDRNIKEDENKIEFLKILFKSLSFSEQKQLIKYHNQHRSTLLHEAIQQLEQQPGFKYLEIILFIFKPYTSNEQFALLQMKDYSGESVFKKIIQSRENDKLLKILMRELTLSDKQWAELISSENSHRPDDSAYSTSTLRHNNMAARLFFYKPTPSLPTQNQYAEVKLLKYDL